MDSDRRFQHVLEACRVNKTLIKRGVKEGDTVIIGEVCYFVLKLISQKYPSKTENKQEEKKVFLKFGVIMEMLFVYGRWR